MTTLSDELLEEIQSDLQGTCTSLAKVIEDHDLDISHDDLEDRLLDGATPVELCGGCEWWFSPTDLEFDEDLNMGVCDSCAEDDEP